MKSLVFIFLCFLCINTKAQEYNQLDAQTFISDFFESNFPDSSKTRYLESEVFDSLIPSINYKKEVYEKLKDYFSPRIVDSLLDLNTSIEKTFSWANLKLEKISIISNEDARRIIQRASVTIMEPRRKISCRKKKVATFPETKNVVIKTTVPVFYNQYCLMMYSVRYSESKGYSCLYLYKKNGINNWIKEKLIINRVS